MIVSYFCINTKAKNAVNIFVICLDSPLCDLLPCNPQPHGFRVLLTRNIINQNFIAVLGVVESEDLVGVVAKRDEE